MDEIQMFFHVRGAIDIEADQFSGEVLKKLLMLKFV